MPSPVSRTRSTASAVGPLDDHPHPAAGRRVLERIVDQVPDHLLEPRRVAVDVDGLALDLDLVPPRERGLPERLE